MRVKTKLFSLLLLMTAALTAQVTLTNIPAVDQNGTAVTTGLMFLTWPQFLDNNGNIVQGNQQTVKISGGVFTVTLTASDNAGYVYHALVMTGGSGNVQASQFQLKVPAAGATTWAQIVQPAQPPIAGDVPVYDIHGKLIDSGSPPGSGSSTRTWSYSVSGLCQGSVATAGIWLPTANQPTFNSCTSTTQQGEWVIAAANTTANWGLQFVVPTGTSGSWSLKLTWRTADTTTAHALVLQPSYACVATGSAPDNPSYTTLSAVTLNPGSTASVNATASLTFTPTCAAGSQFRLLLTPTSNNFASPAQFSYESISLLASN